MEKEKCYECSKEAEYKLGIRHFKKKKDFSIVGCSCEEHVLLGVKNLTSQAFGTPYWAAVYDFNGKELYNSFEYDQQGIAAGLGWQMVLEEMKSK